MVRLVNGLARIHFTGSGQMTVHEYIAKYTVKGMYPGMGVAKWVKEFAKF